MLLQDMNPAASLGYIEESPIPAHVGIIMDGNGRWASRQGKQRTAGHLEGLKTVKRIVRLSATLGIRYLSLYAFSTENWKRTEEEVSFLMNLVVKYLKEEYDFYRENRIRVVHTGDIEGLPEKVRREIWKVMKDTAQFDQLTVNLAINYGGRNEIVRAVQHLAQSTFDECADIASCKKRFANLDESTLTHWLDGSDLPDVDLLIRSGGEQRISNFMLWKAAYAELYFSDTMWPDWTEQDFQIAINAYRHRKRRFGSA